MNEILTKQSVFDFCSMIGLEKGHFDNENAISQEDFEKAIIDLFKNDSIIFDKYLFKVFDFKVRIALRELFKIEVNEDSVSFAQLFGTDILRKEFKIIESNTGLVLPALKERPFSFLIQLCLFGLPAGLVVLIMIKNIGFFAGNFLLLKWGFIAPFIFGPYVVFYFFFPYYFSPAKLSNNITYREFILELVKLNKQDYLESELNFARDLSMIMTI